MRIAERFQESVFYLYPSESSAEKGEAIGGTGFFVGDGSTTEEDHRLWAVTNRHVIEGGNVVLRINLPDGSTKCVDTEERLWKFHAEGADLAALPMSNLAQKAYVPKDLLISEDDLRDFGFGVGDETFSIGRVISHEGRQKNTPTARFGNIAQMPTEPVIVTRHGKREQQTSFLVEARSISGYSGAPVFTYIPPSSVRDTEDGVLTTSPFSRMIGPLLLGVNWAHMNGFLTAKDSSGKELPYEIQSNSGMMAVVPAWKLTELLDQPLP